MQSVAERFFGNGSLSSVGAVARQTIQHVSKRFGIAEQSLSGTHGPFGPFGIASGDLLNFAEARDETRGGSGVFAIGASNQLDLLGNILGAGIHVGGSTSLLGSRPRSLFGLLAHVLRGGRNLG